MCTLRVYVPWSYMVRLWYMYDNVMLCYVSSDSVSWNQYSMVSVCAFQFGLGTSVGVESYTHVMYWGDGNGMLLCSYQESILCVYRARAPLIKFTYCCQMTLTRSSNMKVQSLEAFLLGMLPLIGVWGASPTDPQFPFNNSIQLSIQECVYRHNVNS